MRGIGRFRRGLVLGFLACVGASTFGALAAGTGSGAAATSPTLDNFDCYTAAATKTAAAPTPFPKTPAKVLVKNQFATVGFVIAPGAVQMHCNPAQKTVLSGGHSVTTPITHAADNLLCRTISAKGVTLPASVVLKNSFGTGRLKPIAVRSLCLPSWEALQTPLKFPAAPAPANLDAFVCYSVVHPIGTAAFMPPPSVTLHDQFGGRTTHIGAPNILCVPSGESVKLSGPTPKIVNPDRSTLCFAVPARVTTRTVYDKNQFGVGAVQMMHNSELCVPSVKGVIVPPPTTTTSTTAPPTTTTLPPGIDIPVTTHGNASVSSPFDITTGPDGALWFTNGGNNTIGRIATDGTITNFGDPSMARPDGIAAGPDGALWFTNAANNSIGRITVSGTVTHYMAASIKNPVDIVAGPDGALWFTNFDNNSIGRITTSGTITNFVGTIINRSGGISFPDGITAGPDGNLWFANTGYGTIGRITTAGVVTIFIDPTMSTPYRIAAGPDGALWFTNGGNNTIGRITTDGTVTNYADASISSPQGITAGPDGALWFMNYGDDRIGRITTSGVVTSYVSPGIGSPYSVTVGPDGALWFTNARSNTIGRITGTP